jgi:hypothetical protein
MTNDEGQSVPVYKRVRVLAGWLFLQTLVVLLIFGLIASNVAMFALLGAVVGAATGFTMLLTWFLAREAMEQSGYRW